MIKIWYDMARQATFVLYAGTKLRFLDRELPHKELTEFIESFLPEGSTGIGSMEIPYSDWVWNTLLDVGEIVDDN